MLSYKLEIRDKIHSPNCSDEALKEFDLLREKYDGSIAIGNEKGTFIYLPSKNPLTKEDLGLKTLEVLAFNLLDNSKQH